MKSKKTIFFSVAAIIACALLIRIANKPDRRTVLGSRDNPHGPALPTSPKILGEFIQARGNNKEKRLKPALKPEAKLDFKKISAKTFLVYDSATKENLAARNENEKLAIASLTKLLTAFVAYENLDLNQTAAIKTEDISPTSPVLGLSEGEQIKLLDLFKAMLIGSANDAALTLANLAKEKRRIAFPELMNLKAKALGMNNSQFSNALGFDSENNFSTAADLKKLVEATQELGAFVNLGRFAEYGFQGQSGKNYKIKATNKLVKSHKNVEAIKTGQSPQALGTLISKISKNGNKIVVIILGSKDREKDAMGLAEEIFEKYEWK